MHVEFCTTLGILKLGTLHGNQRFHWCLVRSWLFAGTCRLLDGLFNLPVADWLNGMNWFKTIITTMKKKRFLHCLSHHYAELLNVVGPTKNSQNLVMQLETDVGSELTLTLFNVTHPGLAEPK